MVGKVAGVFATGSGFGNTGGGAELTMLSVINNLVELGMFVVPLPKNTPGYPLGGLQWGPYGRSAGVNMEQTGVQDASLEAARHHGIHVARTAKMLAAAEIFGA
jgi:NAD(P)H dehydrogenase (quinone)